MSDIINLVRYDKYYRKIGKWPVVPLENIREQYTRSIGIIDGIQINGFPYHHRNVHFVNNPVASLENDYKDIKYLVTNYSVIAAGGAVYKAIYNIMQSTDIDIYFISPRDSEEETLIEIMRYFENKYKDVLFVRNHRCTSIIIQIQDDIQIIYQFIHRTYATKDSVVGGFDISVASAYYDGQIYTTPLGSFCIANRLIVVDHAKYATSYLSRLCKYRGNYNTSLLFINYVSCKKTFNVRHNGERAFRIGYHKASDSYTVFTVNTKGARDYDINMNHIASLGTAAKNSVLAMYNQLDMICWTGTTVENVLKPDIQYTIASRYGGPPPRITAEMIAMLHEVDTGYIEDLRSKTYGPTPAPEYVDEWNRLINGCADKADKIISERIDQARLAAKNGPKWYKCTKYHRAFNHVKISAREFYGKRYIDLQFYIPEQIETLLRLFVKHRCGVWKYVDKVVLENIFTYLYLYGERFPVTLC